MESNNNYGTLIVSSLGNMRECLPEMNFGQILYSVLKNKKLKTSDVSISWLLDLNDSDIYDSIEEAIKNEQEDVEDID